MSYSRLLKKESGFVLIVVKAKRRPSLWVSTKDPLNTSGLEASISKRHQMRENTCEQVTVGFIFFFQQVEKATQRNARKTISELITSADRSIKMSLAIGK